MARRVVISGLGPVSGLGLGIRPTWRAMCEGRSAVETIQAFDACDFACRIAAEVKDFRVNQFVPKWYRKATKVMAREIELAVGAADFAARDAALVTKGTAEDGQSPSYASDRMGAQIGAGLIAADLQELTSALAEARDSNGSFDIHRWGREGINHLTPLWLLKYLPNMLACHVSIIHDTQGPSNTITCGEASGNLSLGESLRVIQRGAADLCFCGGTDTKTNPMGFLRQLMTGRLNTCDNDQPARAVRPFCQTAAGTVVGEGGAIMVIEALESFSDRTVGNSARAYCEVVGFGASQSVNPEARNVLPDSEGCAISAAIGAALSEAQIEPGQIDMIVSFGLGLAGSDQPEANALRRVFEGRLSHVPIVSTKSMVGNCAAGAGALDIAVAAKAILEQTMPAVINCDSPLEGLYASTRPCQKAEIVHALTYSCGMGGQNAAMVLRRC